jgi:hypothetical protein
MAALSTRFWQGRGFFGLHELLQSSWRHLFSFLISLDITVASLALYFFTFPGGGHP